MGKTPTKRSTPRPRAPAAADESFLMEPGGYVIWKIGETAYRLCPLTVGDFQALDWAWRGGSDEWRLAVSAAQGLPNETDDERRAKLEAVNAANRIADEYALDLYRRMFAAAEVERRAFPAEEAPAWILVPGVFAKLLEHLQGPPPPGVS